MAQVRHQEPVLDQEPDSETSGQDARSKVSPAFTAGSVTALAMATAACGGGDGSGSGTTAGSGSSSGGVAVLKPSTDAEAARFVLRASISANTGSIEAVKTRGYEPWLNQQMNASNDQSAAGFMSALGYDAVDANKWYFRESPTDYMIWNQLMTGGNSVRKRAALALSEFFVVSVSSINITWRSSAMAAYWDLLNDHVFGNFRDLLEAVTLSPAMGVFLNTRGNRKADPSSGRVPDENYGREVMQLFSIGLVELNDDGTVRLGSNGDPIETYSNDDVTEISKAFTGYDYDYTGIGYTAAVDNPTQMIQDAEYAAQPMTADPSKWRWPRTSSYHSDEAKSFLGVTIPAQTGAEETLKTTLDTLFNHANVGPFFSKQMIQRLVTSNPSPDYVRRVASVFNDNGSGTRGDLRAVFKAILLDDEALAESGLNDLRFGKLREPMVRFAQLGRTFGVTSESGNWEMQNLSDPGSRLGQAPLRSPSVFNFFRPGHVPSGSQAAANEMVAPEFQIANETSVAGYVNFMDQVIDGRSWLVRDLAMDYTNELEIAHDANALLDRIDLLLTGQQLRESTRETILTALTSVDVTEASDEATKLRRIHIAVFLVMVSNDYLIQK